MTTQQAFKKLLKSPSLLEALNENPATIRKWRQRLKEDKIEVSKMEEILEKAGAKKKPEHWEFPVTSAQQPA